MNRLVPIVLLLCSQAFAGNWYVSKTATGTAAGTSWTNAWTDFNSINFASVACGDTIWVAGNNGGAPYTGSMTINKTCTAGNVLQIKRVLATDAVPVAAAGWSATFDSQVVDQNGGVTMQGAFWTIDGRVGDASTGVAYGMQWIWPTQTGTAFGNAGGSQANITVTHIEIYGPLCVSNNGDGSFGSGTCTGNTWGFNLNQGTGNTNFLLDHVWIHRWAEVIRPFQTTGLTIQYSYLGDSAFTPSDHNDCMYASDPFSNFTLRYSRIYSCANQGLFFDNNGVVNAKIYDNIFYHSQGTILGWPRCASQSACGPVYLFNNIFENDGTWGEGNVSTISANSQPLNSSSLIQNNIFYVVTDNVTSSLFSFDASTTSNSIGACSNCFNYTQASPLTAFTGWVSICGTSCTGPSAIINSDFHLTASGKTLFQAKGTNLTSTACVTIDPAICTDMDGNTRPTSGAWTLGPFEATVAAAAAVSLNPSSVNCGNSQIGVQVACTAVSLTNTGNATLNIASIAVGGTNSGDFSKATDCGATLGAGLSCNITPSFNPTAGGARAATISITDDAAGSPHSVTLSGNGGIPVASLTPSSLTFGSLNVSGSSAPQTLTLSNTGTAALSITSISLTGSNTGDFFQSNNCPVGSSVGTGSSCTITVTFTPLAVGARSASVSVVDGAAGSPHASTLSGTGVQPSIASQINPGVRMSGRATVK